MVEKVKDFRWKKNMSYRDFIERLGNVGYQSVELKRAADAIVKMKKERATTFLTFTSNMVTSGLRGYFSQLVEYGIADVIVTTIGGIEEDIMKASGDEFIIGRFDNDDFEKEEEGVNRIGNLFIENQSYLNFEETLRGFLKKLYERKCNWTPSEIFREIGLMINDENSILYQAAKKGVPVFCPAITDGAFGFHLYLFQQDFPDFVVDIVRDFKNIILSTSYDERKAVICLGGSISKHHAILSTLLNGGAEYAVYMTTSKEISGSVSGASTREAKSWGKIKDESDAVTVYGDVTVMFPMTMCYALDRLHEEGVIENAE